MAESFDMIAKTFFGLENVLAEELEALGAERVRPGRRMCAFRGTQLLMYRANVECRTAVRVLKPIYSFTAADEQALYRGMQQIDWRQYLDVEGSLAIDPVVHSVTFTNSLYVAQLAKDAVVDQLRRGTRRPMVDLQDPQLRINLHVDQQRVTVYLDASGDSLHKRGYRAATGEAPLNEVLAAGILRLTGWDACSPLADFMCGSGTFLIEAALMARRIVPGLLRRQFGYMRWRDYCSKTHAAVLEAAQKQVRGPVRFPIQGSDLDAAVIEAARTNARRAGVDRDIAWKVENFEAAVPPAPSGTLVVNPPYDERMKAAKIAAVYRRLGDVLKHRWGGYTAWILTGNLDAAKQIGLRSSRRVRLFNGPIECRLLKFPIEALAADGDSTPTELSARHDPSTELANRLARMAKHWHRAARRQQITAYRLYDRDLPEVPLAVDWYDGHLLVSEYARAHSRTEIEQHGWLRQMAQVIGSTLEMPGERVHLVTAAGQCLGVPSADEERSTAEIEVREGPLVFATRLGAGRETGLALDRRILRAKLREEAAGKRCLSLWAGGGTAAVAMGAGGAAETVSVEKSAGLVALARRNWQRNRLDPTRLELACDDPLAWLERLTAERQFDLIVVDAPGFDGKRREGVWNVQDGHAALLNKLLAYTAPGGRIYLVTPFRRFTMHAAEVQGASAREITRQTVPPEFRDRKEHRAWLLLRGDASHTGSADQGG